MPGSSTVPSLAATLAYTSLETGPLSTVPSFLSWHAKTAQLFACQHVACHRDLQPTDYLYRSWAGARGASHRW
jgi:hypothetical protein